MKNCVFCELGNNPKKKNEADLLYEDDKCVVLLDLYPVDYGHLLVIPKKHYANMLKAPDEVVCHMFKIAKKFAILEKERLGADGANISTNIGKIAGQAVMHFHVHVIPRYNNKRKSFGFGSNIAITKEDRIELKELLGKRKAGQHHQ